MIFKLTFLLQADETPYGRVGQSALSDQTLMELLFEGVNEDIKQQFQDGDGFFHDACTWEAQGPPRVILTRNSVSCDDENRVTAISFSRTIFGVVDLVFLPPKVMNLQLENLFTARSISGTLETSKLPECLLYIELSHNAFFGTVDLGVLPREVYRFDVANNTFEGSCMLTSLPHRLEILNLYSNAFTGSIELGSLPETLKDLNLSKNKFSGTLSFSNIPREMISLGISENQFSGSLVLLKTPSDFSLRASENAFHGTAVLSNEIEKDELSFRGNRLEDVVDENGNTHALADAIKNIQKFHRKA